MKHKKLIVEDWHICYCMDIGAADMATISEKIDSLKAPSKMKEGAFINLSRENCGSTIANQTQKKILVLISPQSSKAELINTLAHENRHSGILPKALI